MNKLVVGLVGGIGSGKSSVAVEFVRHGGRVVSGDRFGHDALRQAAIRDQVVSRWGAAVLNDKGAVDRSRLGAIVFADVGERRALEALVFPYIKKRLEEEIAAARDDPSVRVVVVDAAVMLEAGWDRLCDVLVYVHAPREQRLRRLAEQRGWTEKEVAARENAQLSLTDKVGRADVAVDNSGSPEDSAHQVERLLRLWSILPGPVP